MSTRAKSNRHHYIIERWVVLAVERMTPDDPRDPRIMLTLGSTSPLVSTEEKRLVVPSGVTHQFKPYDLLTWYITWFNPHGVGFGPALAAIRVNEEEIVALGYQQGYYALPEVPDDVRAGVASAVWRQHSQASASQSTLAC